MDEKRRKSLERHGWRVGDAAEFLRLSNAEAAYVNVKAAMAEAFSKKRRALRMTQTVAAKRLQSSQSRVAKMEADDPSVSLDLLVRSLLSIGISTRELALIIKSVRSQRRAGRAA